ncbi:MAG: peptidase S41 [Firmicutes bacterium]|nr:peptidase S41 [Bacillota bacterium]
MDKYWHKKWYQDIEQLKSELPKRHKNLYFLNSEKNFFDYIELLEKSLENLNHFNVICEIGKIIASFGDGHTTLMIPGKWVLPFEFYWFEEGIYIIGTIKKYQYCINRKVTKINGIFIEDIINSMKSIISHENEQFVKSQLPKYLKVAEVLYGLGIIDSFKLIEMEIEGEIFSIETIENLELEQLLEMKESKNNNNCLLPMYRRNRGLNYWWDYLEKRQMVYINYNCCKDMSSLRVNEFVKELSAFIDSNRVFSIVVDLRNNLGGDSTLLDPFIKWLNYWKMIGNNRKVYTIIGRDTFSSALLNAYSLKNDVGALMLGEGTGGKPNCYGEVRYFELNNSKLKIRYSTKYYKLLEDDNQLSLYPDISFEVAFKDYINYKDNVLDFIVSN